MQQGEKAMGSTIWTLGHSTRPLDEFLALLAQYRLEAVADVRRFPGSRRQPQYAEAALSATLAGHCIADRWLPALSGPAPAAARFAERRLAQRLVSRLRRPYRQR